MFSKIFAGFFIITGCFVLALGIALVYHLHPLVSAIGGIVGLVIVIALNRM